MINTPSKRRAAAGGGLFPWLPLPDGTVDSGDRRQVAGCYGSVPIAGDLNDAAKRRAAAGSLLCPVLPVPDGQIDTRDRLQLAGCYRATLTGPLPRTSAVRDAAGARTAASGRGSASERPSA